ncbi:MAG: hypothetical protein ACOX1L_06225 [Erysipelotrichaceae bacterium]|jgi:hypothetical protein
MEKRKVNSPVGLFTRFFVFSFVVAIAIIGIIMVKGYSFTIGKIYFTDRGTYLINENNVAVIVVDTTKENKLFKSYSNGDEILVVHGPIMETYPMTTDGFFAIRLEKNAGSYKPDDDVVGFEPNSEDVDDGTEFSVQYIRTDGYHEDAIYPVIKIIRSANELNEYYQQNKEKYNLDSTSGFNSACKKYDDNYFNNQILIIVLLEEGSGSNRHEVKSLTYLDDGSLTINIERTIPEIGTCDMAQWHLLIEPAKGISIDDESKVSVIINTNSE